MLINQCNVEGYENENPMTSDTRNNDQQIQNEYQMQEILENKQIEMSKMQMQLKCLPVADQFAQHSNLLADSEEAIDSHQSMINK